jgi:hypothetical protein
MNIAICEGDTEILKVGDIEIEHRPVTGLREIVLARFFDRAKAITAENRPTLEAQVAMVNEICDEYVVAIRRSGKNLMEGKKASEVLDRKIKEKLPISLQFGKGIEDDEVKN